LARVRGSNHQRRSPRVDAALEDGTRVDLQSGAVGDRLEAAVATRLLQEGTASVVAMGYRVYTVAAAEFMAAFYERLFAGDRVTEAVTAGRRRLYERSERPSPKGKIPLQDWMVPVHYLGRELSLPELKTKPGRSFALDEALDALREFPAVHSEAPVAATGKFVGRDREFYDMEVSLRRQRVVVVHGPAGTGKTELAKAFGRWWRDSGGVERPEWVIFHSFEPGVASFGLESVVSEIGLAVLGADFARLQPEERLETVARLLAERRFLLIWDNFESVHAMADPSAATPLLDAAGQAELKAFLDQVAAPGSRSAVILTSRTEESWLGEHARIPLGNLAADEAIEYAEALLACYPSSAPRRARRTFGDLLEWLDGHPLSMRLVLPHLDKTDPEQLLAGLQGMGEPPPGFADSSDRRTSLAASVAYSFARLDPRSQRLLVAVALLHDVAFAGVLAVLSMVDGVPVRFRSVSVEDWADALHEAAGVGLLSPLDNGMYRIHPALPAYLSYWWRLEQPDRYDDERDGTREALVSAHARLGWWLSKTIAHGGGDLRFRLIGAQRRCLGRFLAVALDTGRWLEAIDIGTLLYDYWDRFGLDAEMQAWVAKVRQATEPPGGVVPSPVTAAGGLWLTFVLWQARSALERGHVAAAEGEYLRILEMLQTSPTSDQSARARMMFFVYFRLASAVLARGDLVGAEKWCRKALAVHEELGDVPGAELRVFHVLGMVDQARGRLDDAGEWFRKSLATDDQSARDDGAGALHLGQLAEDRGRLDEAEEWFRKSLVDAEERGDRPRTAKAYNDLGLLAQKRGRLDAAEQWYLRSLSITEELDNRKATAFTYHNLGIVARRRDRLDEAKEWSLKALAIKDDLGLRSEMPSTYQLLGSVARTAGRLDEAEQWSLKALAGYEELDRRSDIPSVCIDLAVVARRRGRLDDADDWCHKALAIEEERGNRPRLAMIYGELGMVNESRGRLDEADGWCHKTLAIVEELGDRPGMAKAYHHLGMVAHSRNRLDEADEWFHKTLAIEEELGDRPGMAKAYHHLGKEAHSRNRLDEAEKWYRRSLEITGNGDQPGLAATYLSLAKLAQLRGDLEKADGWCHKALAIVEELGDRPGMAKAYHHLGMVAHSRNRLDEADEWFHKTLAIVEELGDRPGMAKAYHHLGMVAHSRNRLDETDEWFHKTLAIDEELGLGDRPGNAKTYHYLGMRAHSRNRLDEAEQWYRRSLEITGDGDQPGLAAIYLSLAKLARLRGDLEKADGWYHKALTIQEELGDRLAMATTYHQLGVMARQRQRADEAERWYRKSLRITEELGDRPLMVSTYAQLAELSEDRGIPREALEWMIRRTAISEEFPHRLPDSDSNHFQRLGRLLGVEVVEQCWRQLTENPLPPAVRAVIENEKSHSGSKKRLLRWGKS